MNTEYIFSPKDANVSNISDLSYSQSLITERRICEMSELADDASEVSVALSDNGMDIYEVLSLIADGYPEILKKERKDALEENRDRLNYYSSRESLFDKACFSDMYLKKMRSLGIAVSESDFLPGQDEVQETFVYVKNAYADEAYDVFSQDFLDPRVRYASNFREAIKLVSDGAVAYCLLPLEERGTRIASVAELIYRSEMKIDSVIPVFGIDGNADMKYALVSRHYSVPECGLDDDRYLEILIAENTVSTLSDVLSVAESYGIRVYRVNSLTFDTVEGKRGYYSIVFTGESVDFTALLIFLTLFVSDYTAVGIYKNLES